MGFYMCYCHHLPDDETLDNLDATASAQLSRIELAELDEE
jgi:hypothetical protein